MATPASKIHVEDGGTGDPSACKNLRIWEGDTNISALCAGGQKARRRCPTTRRLRSSRDLFLRRLHWIQHLDGCRLISVALVVHLYKFSSSEAEPWFWLYSVFLMLVELAGSEYERPRAPAAIRQRMSSESVHLPPKVRYFSSVGYAHPGALLLREVLA